MTVLRTPSSITRRVLAAVLAAGLLAGATPAVDHAHAVPKPKPSPDFDATARKN